MKKTAIAMAAMATIGTITATAITHGSAIHSNREVSHE